MPVVGAIIAGVGALAKGVIGANQAAKAKRLAESNQRPDFDIQEEYLNNQRIAQSMAQRGLTGNAMNYLSTEADRGFTSATDTALDLGGSPNAISSLYDSYQRNLQQTAAQDSQAQQQNIKYLLEGPNKDYAGQRTQQWALNEYEPYKDKALAASALANAGTQNFMTGLNELGSVATSYQQAQQNDDLLELYRQQGVPRLQGATNGLNTLPAANYSSSYYQRNSGLA